MMGQWQWSYTEQGRQVDPVTKVDPTPVGRTGAGRLTGTAIARDVFPVGALLVRLRGEGSRRRPRLRPPRDLRRPRRRQRRLPRPPARRTTSGDDAEQTPAEMGVPFHPHFSLISIFNIFVKLSKRGMRVPISYSYYFS